MRGPSGTPSDGLRVISPIDQTEETLAQLSLPTAADTLQAPLEAANRRSREDAQAILERAFPTLPIRDSCQTTDAATLVVGTAEPPLLAALNAERLLDEVFRHLTFRGRQVRLVRDKVYRDLADIIETRSGGFAGGHARVRVTALAKALEEGFTVVLDGFDLRSPTSVNLAGLFERAYGCVVNINGYLSAREHTSFGAHWDDQEVVILQLLGHKHWAIEEPVQLSMNKLAHGEAVSGRIAWKGSVSPGDAMYVPRGWGHTVSGLDELSFHYTITIPRVNGLQILDSVLARLPDQPPKGSPQPMAPRAIPAFELPVDPAEFDRLVLQALASTRFLLPRRSTGSLRRSVEALSTTRMESLLVRCPCPGGWVAVPGPSKATLEPPEPEGDHVVAGMAGQLMQIPNSAIEPTGALTDGRVHDAGHFDDQLVRDLISLGIIEVVGDPLAWGLS